jgi:hypothetical protein
MSKNNLIRKSDKKFIRHEKARIRAAFSDAKKQAEMINELYKRFIKSAGVAKEESLKVIPETKVIKEVKKEKPKAVKVSKKIKAKAK